MNSSNNGVDTLKESVDLDTRALQHAEKVLKRIDDEVVPAELAFQLNDNLFTEVQHEVAGLVEISVRLKYSTGHEMQWHSYENVAKQLETIGVKADAHGQPGNNKKSYITIEVPAEDFGPLDKSGETKPVEENSRSGAVRAVSEKMREQVDSKETVSILGRNFSNVIQGYGVDANKKIENYNPCDEAAIVDEDFNQEFIDLLQRGLYELGCLNYKVCQACFDKDAHFSPAGDRWTNGFWNRFEHGDYMVTLEVNMHSIYILVEKKRGNAQATNSIARDFRKNFVYVKGWKLYQQRAEDLADLDLDFILGFIKDGIAKTKAEYLNTLERVAQRKAVNG